MYKADVQILPVLQLGAMGGGKVSYPSLLTFNALRRGVGVGMGGIVHEGKRMRQMLECRNRKRKVMAQVV